MPFFSFPLAVVFCFGYLLSRPLCKLFPLLGKVIWHQLSGGFSDHPRAPVLHHALQTFYFILFFAASISVALCLCLLAHCLCPLEQGMFMFSLCTVLGREQTFTKNIFNWMNELRVIFTMMSLWLFFVLLHIIAHVIFLKVEPFSSFFQKSRFQFNVHCPPNHLAHRAGACLTFAPETTFLLQSARRLPCLQFPMIICILMEFGP